MAIVKRVGYKGFEIKKTKNKKTKKQTKKPLKLDFWMMIGCVPEQTVREWHNPHCARSLMKGFRKVSEQVLLILPDLQ